jgi:REP element-mobilizing transposase RayT
MPNKVNHQAEFLEQRFYHVYNRTVGNEPLFVSDENFRFFLQQYSKYLQPFVETWAYCLLGNHFHLLIRVREVDQVVEMNDGTEKPMVGDQFRKFFQSYAMAFNKQQHRHGALMTTPYKRIEVSSDAYLKQLVYYIHSNPQKHGYVHDFRNWKWSSYASLVSSADTRLQRQDVLDLFGGLESIILEHNDYKDSLTAESLQFID